MTEDSRQEKKMKTKKKGGGGPSTDAVPFLYEDKDVSNEKFCNERYCFNLPRC